MITLNAFTDLPCRRDPTDKDDKIMALHRRTKRQHWIALQSAMYLALILVQLKADAVLDWIPFKMV
jgi:hypothetical protein